jgi:hypothetical protein
LERRQRSVAAGYSVEVNVTERVNYCEPCRTVEDGHGLTLAKRIDLGPEFGDITGEHFRAMNTVLTAAAAQILGPHPAGWVSRSQEPLGVSADQSVLSQLAMSHGSVFPAEYIWTHIADAVGSGRFAEAV